MGGGRADRGPAARLGNVSGAGAGREPLVASLAAALAVLAVIVFAGLVISNVHHQSRA